MLNSTEKHNVYNTQRPHLNMPEYGRNVQQMVEYCMSVEDRNERNKVAQAIINVMGQLNPHLRDVEDFKHKLWAHLFIISDFQLDVDSPYPIPTKETFTSKPNKVTYPKKDVKYGHYGKTVELMIKEASGYEEGEEKMALVLMIANLMKRMYLTWNRDSVTDEIIFEHLDEMSNGKIKLKDVTLSNANMGTTSSNVSFKKKKKHLHKGKHQHQNKKRY